MNDIKTIKKINTFPAKKVNLVFRDPWDVTVKDFDAIHAFQNKRFAARIAANR